MAPRYARRRREANSLILLQSRTLLQALILAPIVSGAARALYTRRYPTRERAFVRHFEPPPRP